MSILSEFKKFRKYIKTDNGYMPYYEKTIADAVVMGDGTDETQTLETEISNLNTEITTLKNATTELTATLAAGETSVTFTDASITADSTIDIYTNIYGVNPTAMSIDADTSVLTITFESQDADVDVKVRVS